MRQPTRNAAIIPLFSFYALQPFWLEWDRFYKVYATRDALFGARIAGQIWNWRTAFTQLLSFAPAAYWLLRLRRQREARCDRLISNPAAFLAFDSRNFIVPRSLICEFQPTQRARSWRALSGGSTLTMKLDGAPLLDLIVTEPETSHTVADRLFDLGYAAAERVPSVFAMPPDSAIIDNGNPYRAPRFD